VRFFNYKQHNQSPHVLTTSSSTHLIHAHHTDKNPGDEVAKIKQQEISRAYEVLSDPEKRQVYDLEGQEGLDRHEKGGGMQAQNPFDMFFGGGGGGGGRRKGQDAQVEIEVTLEELYNGGSRQARISRNVICPKCRGTGAKDGEQQRCHACGGKGVRMVQQQMAPGFVVQMQETCGECGGKGQIYKSKCPHCQGKKVVPDEKTLTAQIERGMPSNGQIVFERESEQSPGVTPGDVIFKFKQTPHKLFKREGDDLHYELHISLREALLGYSRVIKHLDGRDVKIEAKGVTQPFQVRKMSGEGMPQHNTPSQMGVLHVKNIVDLPSTLNQEQKDAIAKVFT